jgi:hypothetical protein
MSYYLMPMAEARRFLQCSTLLDNLDANKAVETDHFGRNYRLRTSDKRTDQRATQPSPIV